jgi:hypothetical protein
MCELYYKSGILGKLDARLGVTPEKHEVTDYYYQYHRRQSVF